MSLRLRLFALLLALAALLSLGEWALVRKLSADLEDELAATAERVGRDVLRMLDELGGIGGDGPGTGSAGPGATGTVFHKRVMVVHGPGRGATADAQTPAAREQHAAPRPTPLAEASAEIHEETARLPPAERPHFVEDQIELRVERVEVPGGRPDVLMIRGTLPPRRVLVPTSGVEEAIGRFTRRLLLGSLGLFSVALLLGVVVTHRFTRPLRDLAAAARQVGEGGFGAAAPAAPGEVGEAIAAFNQMSARLLALDAEARRLRASEQLSELGEVGRGLAHSLRNPLNALGLALEELVAHAGASAADGRGEERGELAGEEAGGGTLEPPPDAAAIAAAARRQIRRIDAALRGFLALAAGEAPAAPVDLVAVARDVALEALQARPATGPVVTVTVDAAEEPLHLSGVEAELRAALQALVVNAVEASPPGGAVSVALARERGAVSVTVADRGGGIPAAVRERLFTPHVTTKAAGAGVGLYLAHRLATTRYGGDLAVSDRPQGGTLATLRLHDRTPSQPAPPARPGAAPTGAAASAPGIRGDRGR